MYDTALAYFSHVRGVTAHEGKICYSGIAGLQVRGILWNERLWIKVEGTKGKEGEKDREGHGWQDARTKRV